MTIEALKDSVLNIVDEYPIKRVTLFGSRADDTNREDSDVDLIMEFLSPISLLTLSMIKLRLEEILSLGVDIIHGPIKETDLIEIGKFAVDYNTWGKLPFIIKLGNLAVHTGRSVQAADARPLISLWAS